MLNKQILAPLYEKTNKFSSIILYCIIGLIFVGILVTSIFGFNKNIEFTGGNMVSITLGEAIENNAEYNSAVNYLKKELGKNGFNFYSAQRQDEGVETTIVLKYTGKITEEKTNAFNSALETKFSIASTEISEHETIDPTINGREVVWTIAGILILATLVVIYMCIRFNFAVAIAMFGAMLSTLGLFVTLMGITRTLSGITLFGAFMLISIYVAFESNMFAESFKKLNELDKEESKVSLVDKAIKNNLSRFVIVNLLFVIFGLLLIVFPPITTLYIGLMLIYACISTMFTMLYVFPFIFKFALRYVKEKQRKKKETKSVSAVEPTVAEEKE